MFRGVAGVLAIATLLGGCFNSIDALVATPTPTQVAVFASETGTLTVTDAQGIRPMVSSEYLLASINYTNQKCDEFFDKLARFQQDSSFVDKVLASSIAAATPFWRLMAWLPAGSHHGSDHRVRAECKQVYLGDLRVCPLFLPIEAARQRPDGRVSEGN